VAGCKCRVWCCREVALIRPAARSYCSDYRSHLVHSLPTSLNAISKVARFIDALIYFIYDWFMSDTLLDIARLIEKGQIRISAHGYDELAADDILVREVVAGVATAVLVEDYPDYHKGPAVLVRQYDDDGNPLHVVWGIPKGATLPAVLVTAYRPDPERWSSDFLRRES
jgi:hypothetical protein